MTHSEIANAIRYLSETLSSISRSWLTEYRRQNTREEQRLQLETERNKRY